MKNQCQDILEALQAGDRLTPLDALDRFDCFRLSARIYDLKKQGHNIQTRRVVTPTGKYIIEYYMERILPVTEPQQQLFIWN